jgi:hypothetical protein
MKDLFSISTLKTLLNVGGTAAIVAGVWLLPIDLAFRLIILGVTSLILWHTIQ